MLLKDLLEVLPDSQKVKILFIKDSEIREVKGSAGFIKISFDMLNYPVMTAYTNSSNNIINICI